MQLANTVLFSWARKPEIIGTDPALVHFAGLSRSGQVTNWLWLFTIAEEPVCLRLLPRFARDLPGVDNGELDLIEATLPQNREIYVQTVPADWLRDHPLDGIDYVWLGFDRAAYKEKRSIGHAVSAVMEVEEFKRCLRR
ncbi:MAG: hypothetical protein DDT26_01848 [Dehalococcoidia bacterium]|nr:hypothetical protein [Chloroflexota bacterium]